MTDNPLLQNLTPHLTQRGRFRPEPGARIAITLPGEVVAGIVIKVVTADTLIVQLGPVFFKSRRRRISSRRPGRLSFSHRRLSHRRPRRCRRLIPIIVRAPPPTRSRRGSWKARTVPCSGKVSRGGGAASRPNHSRHSYRPFCLPIMPSVSSLH